MSQPVWDDWGNPMNDEAEAVDAHAAKVWEDARRVTRQERPIMRRRAIRLNRWLARFRRQHGPLVRLWDADFNLLHAEPVRNESWSAWSKRQVRRQQKYRQREDGMKISELIAELRQAQVEHGDVDVFTVRSDMGDYDPELTFVDYRKPPHLYIG